MLSKETIDSRTWRGQQSKSLAGIYRIVDKTFRSTCAEYVIETDLERDSYDHQSHARVRVFSNGKWEFLYSIPYPHMVAVRNKISYVEEDKVLKALQIDEARLLNVACDILFGIRLDE